MTRAVDRWTGRAFRSAATLAALLSTLVLAGVAYVLVRASGAAIVANGAGFLGRTVWDPVHGTYGAAPAIVGTVETSLLALLFAVPVAVGAALFVAELAPRWARGALATLIDLTAAVPSVVFGLWGILVVAPVMQASVEPSLARITGGRGPFSGIPGGFDLLAASVVLAMMIVPTVSALSRAALEAVPALPRESALALGASRWESVRIAVLGPARGGFVAGALLGLGRALGEAIVVVSLFGNIYAFPTSLFSPGSTLASEILNGLEGSGPAERASLIELGVVLLLLSVLVQLAARFLARPWKLPWRTRTRSLPAPPSTGAVELPAPPISNARAGRRRFRSTLATVLGAAAAGIAIAPLVSVVATAVANGGDAVVRPSFYTSPLPAACPATSAAACPLGGIGPAIEGTLILVGLAALFAVPLGILVGFYLSEYGRGRWAATVRFAADTFVGVPSILVGLTVVVVLLATDPHLDQTAYAGAAALSLLMLPIVARASETAFGAVPAAEREAALALGFPKHRSALRVVLPAARTGVATGVFLAVARAGGETAAVVLTAFSSPTWFAGLDRPIASLAPLIFQQGVEASYPNWQADAWGAALVLLLLMLAVSLAGRALASRRGPVPEG